MKSAYEIALERLEGQGISRPSDEALSDHARQQIAEIRRQAEARLAETEIRFRDRRRKISDPAELERAEEEYRIDRRRIEDRREREIAALRRAEQGAT